MDHPCSASQNHFAGEEYVESNEAQDAPCAKRKRDDHSETGNQAISYLKSENYGTLNLTLRRPERRIRPYLFPTYLPMYVIFDEFEFIEDVPSLSRLASRSLFEIGQKHIENYVISCLAPLADKQICCVGDYVEMNDQPSVTQEKRRSIHIGRFLSIRIETFIMALTPKTKLALYECPVNLSTESKMW
ncbi:uncharacterized protein PADG_11953 [Paracoccidioides brasiliensis Pb18]|uniref:Uncharacterized protein n=1 Tax=Paracoccidioides brasiliensis (strain Pb18) TaxID=502780 RepID=A0A0A0HUE8_PARBD|nr:uncharacterized protein PADG_11953 [Paracoccidioides brasiliensis Pb18]KGM91973.1 hypothetical protein PADG_11953 [Paracoccidioides brasiliensis Pb18]